MKIRKLTAALLGLSLALPASAQTPRDDLDRIMALMKEQHAQSLAAIKAAEKKLADLETKLGELAPISKTLSSIDAKMATLGPEKINPFITMSSSQKGVAQCAYGDDAGCMKAAAVVCQKLNADLVHHTVNSSSIKGNTTDINLVVCKLKG